MKKKMMRHGMTCAAVALLLLLRAATALDVEIESFTCDSSYPVTADIYMECQDGSSRCTFGEQITVYGDLYYNNVANSGVNGETAYLSAELSLFSIDFALVNKQAVPLCYFNGQNNQGQYQEEGNEEGNQQDGYYDQQGNQQEDYYNEDGNGRRLDQENQCPANGAYPYKVQYVLPSAGKESASWLASGWTGTGILEMYAQRNDQMKIGECSLVLSTYVTKEDDSSLLNTPSAAATAGIILAVLVASMLMCFYCYCCIKSRKIKKDELAPGDDVTSSFRRMDEDEHSKPPTISVDVQSQAASKKSWVSTDAQSQALSKKSAKDMV